MKEYRDLASGKKKEKPSKQKKRKRKEKIKKKLLNASVSNFMILFIAFEELLL